MSVCDRRKLTVRIIEVDELIERERTRANTAEKARAKQAQELKELADELDRANAANSELVRRVKAAEQALPDLQHRVEALEGENAHLHAINSQLMS